MTTATIRPASPADAGAVADLGAEVVPATYGPIDAELAHHQLRTWWSEQALAERMERLPHWVAESDDGRVLGVSDLGRHDDRAVVWKVYLRPGSQGQGLGRALLDRALTAADGEDVWLDVFAENHRAIAFYRSQGFEVVDDDEAPRVLGHTMLRMRWRA
jgi:ribosomal protein S18 acetylase RimI-like enzyme